MHIAIEGMDGVGKTSQAKAIARRLGGEFIAKSFHEMADTKKEYDNFITIHEYTNNEIKGKYGLRRNYYLKKIRNENVVTDRFYVSNFWLRSERLSLEYFQRISEVWGIPDIIIILYAKSEVLYSRIFERNPNDKDLCKIKMADEGYKLMFEFVKKMNFTALVVDTSDLEFEKTSDIIMYAIDEGMEKCKEKYSGLCYIIKPQLEVVDTGQGKLFLTPKGELVQCESIGEEIRIPENVCGIRERAFSNSRFLKRIILPKTVITISDYAFDESSVSEIYIAHDNPIYSASGNFLYNKDKTVILKFLGKNQKEVYVSEGTSVIGNTAFAKCKTIERIILPRSIKQIKYGAFIDCSKLNSLKLYSNQIETIEAGAFIGCMQLTDIDFEEAYHYFIEDSCIKNRKGDILYYFGQYEKGVLYQIPKCSHIFPYAFQGRLRADKIIIDDTTVKVGSFAFECCDINKIEIRGNLAEIGENSFGKSGIKEATIFTKIVPEIWKNSFCIYRPDRAHCTAF